MFEVRPEGGASEERASAKPVAGKRPIGPGRDGSRWLSVVTRGVVQGEVRPECSQSCGRSQAGYRTPSLWAGPLCTGPALARSPFVQSGSFWELAPLHLGLSYVSSQRVQFGMYALYSKNKPRSDALMASYGHSFFKVGEPECRGRGMAGVPEAASCSPPTWQDKQRALGDHLDVASYLLKPIQRMSKYALLLQELARACGGPMQELSALQAAQSLVRFQLRHGNDLLAMDAIQGCDVSYARPWWAGAVGVKGGGQRSWAPTGPQPGRSTSRNRGSWCDKMSSRCALGATSPCAEFSSLRSCCSSASLVEDPQASTCLPTSAPSR